MTKAHTRTPYQNIGLVLGPLLGGLVLLLFQPDPPNPLIPRMAAIGILMATWWMTEALPLAATSLLPMVLCPLAGVGAATATAQAYMNSIIFLYMGGFLVALAMERWGLHRRIALAIIAAIGGRPNGLVLGFMLAGTLISMWISNTAVAVMMLPIALAIIGKLEASFGAERTRQFSLVLLLAVAYGASIGGIGTPVGTPTNLAAIRIYEQAFPGGPPISFGQWVLVGAPAALVIMIATWLVLTRVAYRFPHDMVLDRTVIQQERSALGPMSYEEKVVVVVGSFTALLWVFRGDLPVGGFVIPGWSRLAGAFRLVDDSTVALAMALVLFIIPAAARSEGKTILEARAFRDLPWDAILLFGGGFAMAEGFSSSGLVAYMATQFAGMSALSTVLTVIAGCVAVAIVTEFVSNIATVQMLLPVLASLAVAREINPLVLMVPAAMTSSMAFMFPVGTPPNAVIFGSGRVRIYQMAWAGFFVKVVSLILVITITALLVPLVFEAPASGVATWLKK